MMAPQHNICYLIKEHYSVLEWLQKNCFDNTTIAIDRFDVLDVLASIYLRRYLYPLGVAQYINIRHNGNISTDFASYCDV